LFEALKTSLKVGGGSGGAGGTARVCACWLPTAAPVGALQNIDTDQIIPAEYLTLVPSKVRPLVSRKATGLRWRHHGKGA
jgi:hypothetical protein